MNQKKMSLKVYNTLNAGKVEFQPLEDKRVNMYVCGPTVYDSAHLGHARAAVVFDVMARYLRYRSFDVRYVRNYTDVDDKIIARAREREMSSQALAEHYIAEFEADMSDLGVADPDIKPKVTEHMDDIIALIQTLVDKKAAYAVEGDVYYSIESFENYGKLSHRDLESMEAGARVEVDLKKHHPMDFALWKKAKPDEPAWDSPWGPGRPGWHIECSAMSMKYLGETLDIHGGGRDLVFPHHENEVAQSEKATGKPFARYWLHNGFVNVNTEKMSKSLGNFMTVRQVLERYHRETVRFFLLSANYRTPIDFTLKNLESAEKQLERFYLAMDSCNKLVPEDVPLNLKDIDAGNKALWYAVDDLSTKFEAAMDDDFNTALVIGHIYDVVREINKVVIPLTDQNKPIEDDFLPGILSEARKRFQSMGAVLGLFVSEPRAYLDDLNHRWQLRADVDPAEIQRLIDARAEARKARDFKGADAIRDQLTAMGIEIEDKPGETLWRVRG